MASHSGGPPAVVGRARGRGRRVVLPVSVGRAVGRGRGRGIRERGLVGGASLEPPISPGTPSPGPPPFHVPSDTVAVSASDDGSRETFTHASLRVKVNISSLGSNIDIDDIKTYFATFCGYSCELSCAVLLGGGKAELELDGLSVSDLQELRNNTHQIKGTAIKADFQQLSDDGPTLSEGESDREDEPVEIKVENVPHTVSMRSLKTFFESERSGGRAGAVADISAIEPGVFHVTFHDRNVAAQVMSKPRAVKRSVLQMSLLEKEEEEVPSEAERSDSGDELNQIEVRNVPETATERVLKTYFETTKSNSCEKAVSDCKQVEKGVFTVTFHDPEVAARVMSKPKHTYKDAVLSLQYVRRHKMKNQLLIRGLPDQVEKEEYELIVEDSCTGLSVGEFELSINDDSTAIINFKKDFKMKELQTIMKHIAGKDVDGTTVTVEMIRYAKPSIHVSNIPRGFHDEDILKVYFSKSGGGEVESVMLPSETEAIITFVDPRVIPRVLQKSHAFGHEVVLKVHGISSTQSMTTDSDTVSLAAEPLEVSLDPLLLQSISLNASPLQQGIENSQVKFEADEEKGMLVFSPIGRPKPNWREECEKLVPQCLAIIPVPVPKEAATETRSLMVSLNKDHPSLRYDLNTDGTEITIAGETSSVSNAKKAIESLCSELSTDCTEKVLLSPEGFDFVEQVKQCDFPPSIECTFDHDMFTIALKGPKGSVVKLKESMESIASHTEVFVIVEPPVIEFFKTATGRVKLKEFLQQRKCHVAVHFTESHALFLLVSDQKEVGKVKAVAKQLPRFTMSQTLLIPDLIVHLLIDSEEFIQLCKINEEKFKVLIKHVGQEVSIAGFKDQVLHCDCEIRAYLKHKESPSSPLEVEVGSLIARSVKASSQGLQKCVLSFNVELQCDTEKGILQFTPLHYLSPVWEEKCRSAVSEFLKHKVVVRNIMVPEKASSEILSVLINSQQSDSTFVSIQSSPTSLSFAGSPDIIKCTEQRITQICSNHEYMNKEVPLDPELFEFLKQVKLKSVKRKFHGVNLKLVRSCHSLTLSGPAKEVTLVQEYLPSLKTRMVSIPVLTKEAIFQHLISEKGRESLFNLVQEKRGDKCATYIQESPAKLSLLCTQKHRSTAEKIKKSIFDCTLIETVEIPHLLRSFFPELPEFSRMVASLQEEISAMIAVAGDEIVVAGFRDGVEKAVVKLSVLVKEKEVYFQPVLIPIDSMKAQCIQDDLESLALFVSTIHVTCKLNTKAKNAAVIISPKKNAQPGWKEECKQLFLSYINDHYMEETIPFPEEVAQDVTNLLSNKNLRFTMDADDTSVTFAGKISVIKGVQKQIQEICTKKQISRPKTMSDREYDFFTQVVQKTIRDRVDFELIPEKHTVVISGSAYDVDSAVKSVEEAIQHDKVPISVDEVVVHYIDGEGKEELERLIHEANIKAAIHIKMFVTPPTLELICEKQSYQRVKTFADNFHKRVTTTVVPLSKTVAKPPLSQEFHKYCQELTTKHHVLIKTTKRGELQICGFRKAAEDVQRAVEEFIKEKCTVSHSHHVQKGTWKLLNSPMKPRLNKIISVCHSSNVSIKIIREETRGKFIIQFKGDESEVQKIVEDFNCLIQSIHTCTVPLKSTQTFYFCEKGDGVTQILGIQQQANVVIEVCSIAENKHAAEQRSMSVSKYAEECTAQVFDMKCIRIHVGDITEFKADIIVNAANEDLRHIGGLAYAILQKGGKEIQEASDCYIRNHGKLSAGDVWLSKDVGTLSCLALIHAVGPRWQGNLSGKEQLRKACINCLTNASNYKSIAFPAISSGVFGCPIDQCADTMISATVEFCKSQRSFPLDDINIVLFKESDVPHFIEALETYLPPQNVHRKSRKLPHKVGASAQPIPQGFLEQPERKEEHYEETGAGMSSLSRVCIREGSLLDVKAEIYVNSTNASMDLSGGAVAKAISKAAGPALQAECTKKAPIAAGEIAVTGPGNIQGCKCIIHVNCPDYRRDGGQGEKMLRILMNKCMTECDKQGACSIAFPAIGTGILRFPVATAADIMVDEVCNYLQKNKCEPIRNVYIMIYNDKEMHHTFIGELEKRKRTELVPMRQKKKVPSLLRGRRADVAPQTKHKDESATNLSFTHPLDFGNGISMQIVKGDITTESSDVIVNTTNKSISLDAGVSLALARRAGKKLQEACNALKSIEKKSLREGKVIETECGNLNCKCIFHVMFQKHNFVEVVSACIEKARERQYKSISFPAIGTGREKYPADMAAKDMIKGMSQCRSSSQVHVRVVLFQEEVYSKFTQVVESHRASLLRPATKADSACRDPLDPTFDISTVDCEIKIFGETKECVHLAERHLHELINQQFKTEKIHHKKICLLRERQVRTLIREACNMKLLFHINHVSNAIEVEGNIQGIYEMKLKVKDALSEVEKAEVLMKTVQWKRHDSGASTSYDMLVNLEIEENKSKSSHTFKDDVSEEHFTIDYKTMEETDHTLGDKTRRVIRDTMDSNGLPEHWEPMVDPVSKQEVPLRVIDLAIDSKEYQFALAEFNRTMQLGLKYTAIVKIQRIQNPVLYKQYIAKKKDLESRNPQDITNERWLFHGTKGSSVTDINATHFNRSLCGQNATVWGRGCYFARDASYSNGYAPPDSQNQKHMYVARVLTGEFTTGRRHMLVAPQKGPSVLYDSVVNDTINPTIFVVFIDTGAYPEYLITYI